MKKRFVAMIDAEIKNHLMGKPAYIKIKINHVTEPLMVSKIYEAAKAGVKIDMLVRGNCALTSQVETDASLSVKGIIDRYLEHARIFCFCNGGDERVFIGSADWMPRNLDNRIEVVTPVYDPDLKAECIQIIDAGLADNTHAHMVVGQKTDKGAEVMRSQEALYNHYLELQNEGGQSRQDQEKKEEV